MIQAGYSIKASNRLIRNRITTVFPVLIRPGITRMFRRGPTAIGICFFPTNTYEIFGMGAQSYSLALGAQTNVGGAFNSLLQVELDATPYNFGSKHLDHDAQFVSDNMTRAVYWNQLLFNFGLQH